MIRQKMPDKKNALSIVEGAKREMSFTLTLPVNEDSASTITRNIYECFRMLGDSLLVAKGIKSLDHIAPIRELLKLQVKTNRPIQLIENLRRLRHNINYYGHKATLEEAKDTIGLAKSCFTQLLEEVLRIIKGN